MQSLYASGNQLGHDVELTEQLQKAKAKAAKAKAGARVRAKAKARARAKAGAYAGQCPQCFVARAASACFSLGVSGAGA